MCLAFERFRVVTNGRHRSAARFCKNSSLVGAVSPPVRCDRCETMACGGRRELDDDVVQACASRFGRAYTSECYSLYVSTVVRGCEDGVGAGEGHSFKHAVSTVCMSKRRPPKHAMLRMHIDHRRERDASGKAC